MTKIEMSYKSLKTMLEKGSVTVDDVKVTFPEMPEAEDIKVSDIDNLESAKDCLDDLLSDMDEALEDADSIPEEDDENDFDDDDDEASDEEVDEDE